MENTGGNQQVLVGSRLETLGSFSRLPRLITRHFSSWMKVIRRVDVSFSRSFSLVKLSHSSITTPTNHCGSAVQAI